MSVDDGDVGGWDVKIVAERLLMRTQVTLAPASRPLLAWRNSRDSTQLSIRDA